MNRLSRLLTFRLEAHIRTLHKVKVQILGVNDINLLGTLFRSRPTPLSSPGQNKPISSTTT